VATPTTTLTARPPALPDDGDVRELRLALVCYGGVSLAIYMHGITKELEKLARASTAFAAGGENPFEPEQTEHAYFNALRRRAAADGYRTRVVIDIIAGTSAGGINGVCLAKALALDAPQDGLRDLWLTKGAILKLLSRMPKLPPLAGNRMLAWLGTAFGDMDGKSAGSLMPPGLALNLFVTTTDINGYSRTLPVNDPPAISTVVNRHVFEFVDRDGEGNLDGGHNSALAFAARATSCFPGAFPATRLADILDGEARSNFPGEFCRAYELAGSPVDKTYFVDGGVLDNFPFRHAVRAIPGKPAATQVDRRLLFIEPDPAPSRGMPDGTKPGWAATIWAGLSKLPRRQPISDALDELDAYNRRVQRIRQMIGAVENDVTRAFEPFAGGTYDDANRAINEHLAAEAPLAFQAYLQLKLFSVVEGIASSIGALLRYPAGSTQEAFVREAVVEWARRERLLEPGELTEAQRAFLRTFDLGYGRRRLAFVIGRINHYYGDAVDRSTLNALKHGLYVLKSELDLVLAGDEASTLVERVRSVFGVDALDPYLAKWQFRGFVDAHREAISALHTVLGAYLDRTLDGFGARAHAELGRLSTNLPAEARDDLNARYVGFAFWDVTTYPVRALTDVAELDEVKVVRISPLDTHRLQEASTAADKLHGVAINHFGAFFRRSWRENDYLWGRLDGAERLLWLLGDTTDAGAKEAFQAVIAEEGPALRKAQPLVRRVREYIDGVPQETPAPIATPV
jgi:patatin-related protein